MILNIDWRLTCELTSYAVRIEGFEKCWIICVYDVHNVVANMSFSFELLGIIFRVWKHGTNVIHNFVTSIYCIDTLFSCHVTCCRKQKSFSKNRLILLFFRFFHKYRKMGLSGSFFRCKNITNKSKFAICNSVVAPTVSMQFLRNICGHVERMKGARKEERLTKKIYLGRGSEEQ